MDTHFSHSPLDDADLVPLPDVVRAAAELVGASPISGGYRKLLSLTTDGLIPGVREGRLIFVPRSELRNIAARLGMRAEAHATA